MKQNLVLIAALAICTVASHSAQAATSGTSGTSGTRTTQTVNRPSQTANRPRPVADHPKTTSTRSSHSGADFGFKGFGVEAGMVNPQDLDATFGFGGFADLGTIAPNLRMTTHLNYWGKSESMAGFGDASIRDISLAVRTVYMFPVSTPTVQPYAGGGFGLHFVHAKVETTLPVPLTVEDSQTKFGIDLGGGLAMPVSPKANLFGEGWYGIVSDISQLSLKVGVEFKI